MKLKISAQLNIETPHYIITLRGEAWFVASRYDDDWSAGPYKSAEDALIALRTQKKFSQTQMKNCLSYSKSMKNN